MPAAEVSAPIETDVLGEPYLLERIELPDDDEGANVASLVVRRTERKRGRPRRAVVHLHGYSDYFFQTVAADFWVDRGYDFYAVDLRKYGRSLLPHQTHGFVTDLADYYPELDEAWRRVTERDGHSRVVVSAHSTGGLVFPLWLHDRRPPELTGVFLNSPWLDLNGHFLLRTALTRALDQIGARRPYLVIPRDRPGLYARSLHHAHGGEWEFDEGWRPMKTRPVHAGWLRAVRRGHARVHKGLSIGAPVLVMSSKASKFTDTYDDDVHSHDIVLDVEFIRRWAPKLGDLVTVTRIEGARHDVTLSRQPARDRVFAELGRWLSAYAEK